MYLSMYAYTYIVSVHVINGQPFNCGTGCAGARKEEYLQTIQQQ